MPATSMKALTIFCTAYILLTAACNPAPSGTAIKNADTVAHPDTAFRRRMELEFPRPITLESKVRTINLDYLMWACECPNWIEDNKHRQYSESNLLTQHAFYIEPATPALILPDTLRYMGTVIEATGRFYKEKGYPENYTGTTMEDEHPQPARVFRYTQYRIIKCNYTHEVPLDTFNTP